MFSMNASDMTETQYGVTAHIEVPMRRKLNAQVLNITPVDVVHRNRNNRLKQQFWVIIEF